MDWHSFADPARDQGLAAFFELVASATEALVVFGRFEGAAGVEVTLIDRVQQGRDAHYLPGADEALLLLAADGSELIRCRLEREYAHCVAVNDVDPDGPLISWNEYTGAFDARVPLLQGAAALSIHRNGVERWRGVVPAGPT